MRYRPLVAFLLIIVTLAVFWPATGFDFVNWDDDIHVYENRYLIPVTVDNTLHFWKEPYEKLYIPLTYSVWAMLGWLSQYYPVEPYGLNPRFFHTANIVLHILNTLVVFGILRILLINGFREDENADGIPDPSKVEIAAGLGALVFALHPVQVESAVWITGMKELLCGLFSFVAIREYLAYAVAARNKGAIVEMKYIHYFVASIVFILALLSKPTAVVVPLIAFILDRWAVKRSFKEIVYSLAGWFIVAGLFAIVATTAQKSDAMIFTPPLWARPFIAGDALAFYLYKTIWPFELAIDYGRSPNYVLGQWWGYLTWLVPFSLVVGTLFLKRRGPFLVSMGLFTASLLPVLGFISFLFQKNSTVTDHYLYIPMLGVALLVSWLFLNHHTKLVKSLCMVVAALFVIRVSYQLQVWQSDVALYTNAIKVNPNSSLSYNNMGNAMQKLGKPGEAFSLYQKALRIRPNDAMVHYNLGNNLRKEGKLDTAIYHYKAAIKIRPLIPNLHNNLGTALRQQGKVDEAVYHFKKALQIKPDYAGAYSNLGLVMAENGKLDEAIAYYEKALEILPNAPLVNHNMGLALARQGKINEAISHYKKAVKFEPSNEDVHNNLGIALNQIGKLDEAIEHFKIAVTIKPDYTIAHFNLGIALKRRGKLKEAAVHYSTALKLNPKLHRARQQLERLNAEQRIKDN